MRALPPLVTALALACHHERDVVRTAPATPTATAPTRARSDCPEAPILEWHALRDDAVGPSLGLGGHVQAIGLDDATDPASVSIIGILDVKGSHALERNTHRMARANYTATVRASGLAREGFAVLLEGRLIGRLEITTTLRGNRFRVPLVAQGEASQWPGDGTVQGLRMRLERAIDRDRACFSGTEPPAVPDP